MLSNGSCAFLSEFFMSALLCSWSVNLIIHLFIPYTFIKNLLHDWNSVFKFSLFFLSQLKCHLFCKYVPFPVSGMNFASFYWPIVICLCICRISSHGITVTISCVHSCLLLLAFKCSSEAMRIG